MNKQRKVLITITYNEMGIIIDTKAEEVAQPDTTTHDSIPAKTGKNDGDGTSGDCISRTQAIDVLHGYFDGMLETDTVCPADIYGLFKCFPSAQPELDIGNDGTLHISVTKGQLNNIGRVLVEEDGTIFCKLFYWLTFQNYFI